MCLCACVTFACRFCYGSVWYPFPGTRYVLSAHAPHSLMYLTDLYLQDKEDDVKVGVKSTALRFGDNSKLWLSGFTAAMIPGLLATGIACDQTWPYYLGVAGVIAHLSRQVGTQSLEENATFIWECGLNFDSCHKRSKRKLCVTFLEKDSSGHDTAHLID